MDKSKFRRVRKTTSPQQNPPATSSLTGATASTSSTKFTIEQKVTTGAVKKGPYSVKRSVDPNDVVIKRRLGEGSKPLFSRGDICVNRSVSPKKQASVRASSSDSSSSDDRNRHRGNSSRSQVNTRKSVEKVPYFLDQKREKDRIKRVYGQSRRSRSVSIERRRRMGTSRNRSRTPPSYNRRHRSYGERRSPSRDRYRPHHRTDYSRSRSRSRERRRMSHSRRIASVDERQQILPPLSTQFIPIHVPVDYRYIHPTWGAPMMPSQPRFPFIMGPTLPPPISYVPRHFRPPRYVGNAYQRGNFRPRQY